MQNVREKLRMFSVNQMAAYHTLLEGYNIMRNSSSELIETKWTKFNEMNYRLRSQTNNELKVPEKPKHKCTGFTYLGSFTTHHTVYICVETERQSHPL